jgi:thiol:disulfide interchange protein DsbD
MLGIRKGLVAPTSALADLGRGLFYTKIDTPLAKKARGYPSPRKLGATNTPTFVPGVVEGEMKKTYCVLFMLLASAVAANCQENPVMWKASCPTATVHPGQKFTAKVSARISPGWHIYSITQAPGGPTPTEITVVAKQPFTLDGFVIGPLPQSSYDANFQLETETYEQTASFKVPLAAASQVPAGVKAVAIDVRFQACNERSCLPAKTVHLSAPVAVAK